MLPSWRLALNNLTGRPARTLLMGGATSLAASLIVAVSCAMATAQASLEMGVTRFVGAADARIIHPGNGRFDDTLLETVRGWPGLAEAAGRVVASLTLVHPDHPNDPVTGRIRRRTPRAIGIDFEREGRIRELPIVQGRRPEAPGEILVDPLLVEALDARVGDVLDADGRQGPFAVTVVGVYERRSLGAFQRPRIYIDRQVLGPAAGCEGELTSIYLVLDDSVDVEAFCREHGPEVPDPLVLEPAELLRTGFDQHIRAHRIVLTIATVLTFMSASFIILIGLTTGVTERQRELGLLRCLGAGRRTLFGAQLFTGLLLGASGAVIGIPLGIALSSLLVAVYREYLPTGLALDGPGIFAAAACSLVAGPAGAVAPAVAAGRVTPLEATTATARPVRGRHIGACTIAGLALIAVQLLLMTIGDDETRVRVYAWVGLPCLLVGWVLLAVPFLFLVAPMLSAPIALVIGIPRDVLLGSVLATPFRHGFTAAALMIGMAILVDGWAGGVSVQKDWIDRIRFADGFAMRVTGISPERQEAIAALPFVEQVCPIGYLPARLVDRRVFGVSGLMPNNVICVGFDPDRFFALNNVNWLQGDPAEAIARLKDGDSAIVAERFLVAKNVGVGDRITLGVGRVTKEFEIVGVVSAAGLDLATQLFGIRHQYMEYAMSCVFVDFGTVARVFDNPNAYILQVDLTDDVTDEEATERIESIAPGVVFRTGHWITATVTDIADALLTVQTAIAYAAMVLAALAAATVVAAGIRARRYEYGVLRAMGARRSTLVGLILGEAAIIGITAAVLGTLFGFHLAWVDTRNLRDLAGLPIGVAVPLGPIAIGWLVLAVITLAAAAPTAWRLARQPVSRMLAAGRNE